MMVGAYKLKSICLIFAKGLSTCLPKKNLEKIGGTPLVGLAIQKASCSIFDEVIVSTEDAEIQNKQNIWCCSSITKAE